MDLLCRYSNRPEQIDRIEDILRRIAENDQTDLPGQIPTSPPPRSTRLADRLSASEIEQLVQRYRFGVKAAHLAREYGISLSSVKRLLRQHGARRRSAQGEVNPEDRV